ncbi:35793_t:CDS:2, partial [Racocetra persica]
MLVYAIHKRLPLAFQKTGKQVIKFLCMEGQYLGLFKQHLTRVFVNRKAYRCVFSGPNAYQNISSILDDQCWGIRHYKCNQSSSAITLEKDKVIQSEFIVDWVQEIIKDF